MRDAALCIFTVDRQPSIFQRRSDCIFFANMAVDDEKMEDFEPTNDQNVTAKVSSNSQHIILAQPTSEVHDARKGFLPSCENVVSESVMSSDFSCGSYGTGEARHQTQNFATFASPADLLQSQDNSATVERKKGCHSVSTVRLSSSSRSTPPPLSPSTIQSYKDSIEAVVKKCIEDSPKI